MILGEETRPQIPDFLFDLLQLKPTLASGVVMRERDESVAGAPNDFMSLRLCLGLGTACLRPFLSGSGRCPTACELLREENALSVAW